MRQFFGLLVLIFTAAEARADILFAAANSGSVFAYDTTQSNPFRLTAVYEPPHGFSGVSLNRSGDLISTTYDGSLYVTLAGGGTGLIASGLGELTSVAVDANNSLYLADYSGGTILRRTIDGVMSTFASGLVGPTGLVFDKLGNLYVSEANGAIARFDSCGIGTTFATGLHGPEGMAFDAAGNLYVAEYNSGDVVRFAGTAGPSVFVGGLLSPDGVAFDSAGNLFVADFANNSIYRVTPGGARTFFANTDGEPGMLAILPSVGGPAIPEPSSLVLVGSGLLAASIFRRRRAA